MRATAIGLLAVLSVLMPAPASAHPGQGETITVGDFSFTAADVVVAPGDAVIWFWEGTLVRNHSVTADPGQAEQFDSDPAGLPTATTHPPGQGFVHSFTHIGTFTYHCKVHPQMRGTIEVVPLPQPGRPPRLTGLKIEPGGELARFELSRPGDVVGRIAKLRGGGAKVVETFSKGAREGANKLKLPVRGLKPGRYELRLVAYDSADRRSNEARDRFVVRRR